ncbi:hypothetical protein [Spongiivirga citrea]|uniref:Uncharacterized protein n=1 Tax=Spongiivirga citrea TaxID=1481457 RepID=A0A6M0CHT3_9FLAO|nr:hypothetical protein [Spongiivirga citrea]NER17425.1 hypothetical protein [Spongiivirga citrea]
MNTFFVILVLFLLALFTMSGIRHLYRSYGKEFSPEIVQEFKKKNLTVTSIGTPIKDDWQKSPFTGPPSIQVSFVRMKVLGVSTNPTNIEYRLVLATNKQEKLDRYWVAISNTIFQKTAYLIKKEKKK